MPDLAAEMAEHVRASKTPKGADYVNYEVFLELQKIALSEGYVLQSVEGFEPVDDRGRLRARMDATFSVPHSEYHRDWSDTVQMSVDFATDVLGTVADRQKLKYKVWFDYKSAKPAEKRRNKKSRRDAGAPGTCAPFCELRAAWTIALPTNAQGALRGKVPLRQQGRQRPP